MKLNTLNKARDAIAEAIGYATVKRWDLVEQWAREAKDGLKVAIRNRYPRGMSPKYFDNRPRDYPPGARPPDELHEAVDPKTPWKKRCPGCGEGPNKKCFSGQHYCVSCGQLGYLHGWCACLSPLYEGGACKRAGRRCRQRGTGPGTKIEIPGLARYRFRLRLGGETFEDEVELAIENNDNAVQDRYEAWRQRKVEESSEGEWTKL